MLCIVKLPDKLYSNQHSDQGESGNWLAFMAQKQNLLITCF